jgi:hypothetical protein
MSARSFIRATNAPKGMKSPTTPRSILKRPTPLLLSPTASVQFAARYSIHVSPSPKSVRFPISSELASTYTTFSPSTYDRAAIFSPSYGSSNASKAIEEVFAEPTPKLVNLEPPPKPVQAAGAPPPSRASVRFQQNLAVNNPTPLPREGLRSALLKFPRSPYPSAPMSPARKDYIDAAETRPRVNSTTDVASKRDAVGNESNAATEGGMTAEERLSEDFWKSVQLEATPGATVAHNGPTFIFGTSDGALWSPVPPKATPTGPLALSSMLSPGARTSFLNPDSILSPIPHAPFPSFTAVMSNGTAEFVTVPPRAVLGL